MGYPRLPVEKQCELAPTLLTAMEGKPQPQQDRYAFLSYVTSTHHYCSVDTIIKLLNVSILKNVQSKQHFSQSKYIFLVSDFEATNFL